MPHTTKKLVTRPYLAKVFGCTPQWITQLVAKGMPKESRGQYDLAACMLWYIRFLQKAIERRDLGDSGAPLRVERLRLIKAQADREELELSRARAELIPIDVYQELTAIHCQAPVDAFSGLPVRIAPQLEGQSRSVIRQKLDQAIRGTLTALSQGAYMERREKFFTGGPRMRKEEEI